MRAKWLAFSHPITCGSSFALTHSHSLTNCLTRSLSPSSHWNHEQIQFFFFFYCSGRFGEITVLSCPRDFNWNETTFFSAVTESCLSRLIFSSYSSTPSHFSWQSITYFSGMQNHKLFMIHSSSSPHPCVTRSLWHIHSLFLIIMPSLWRKQSTCFSHHLVIDLPTNIHKLSAYECRDDCLGADNDSTNNNSTYLRVNLISPDSLCLINWVQWSGQFISFHLLSNLI